MDPEEVRQEVRRLSMVGLKVYQHFAPDVDTWEAEIEQFLAEEHVRIAHQEELVVLLHMVKSRALADPVNQEKIRYYCETYPGMRLILAHAGTAFNPHRRGNPLPEGTDKRVVRYVGHHRKWCFGTHRPDLWSRAPDVGF